MFRFSANLVGTSSMNSNSKFIIKVDESISCLGQFLRHCLQAAPLYGTSCLQKYFLTKNSAMLVTAQLALWMSMDCGTLRLSESILKKLIELK